MGYFFDDALKLVIVLLDTFSESIYLLPDRLLLLLDDVLHLIDILHLLLQVLDASSDIIHHYINLLILLLKLLYIPVLVRISLGKLPV